MLPHTDLLCLGKCCTCEANVRQPENNRRLKISPSRFQAALDRVRSKAAHPTVGFRLPFGDGQPESLYCGMIWRGLFCLAFWRRAVAAPFKAA
ncbi:hypothetical protein [uncultured Kingella sp.]|uniref:hypothetical protein n=1 Tax=uncultured Kingella sp. TaxID=159270 RepID=UPI002597C24A|nr:hypothetical protein [uncultured Kingella sp.]